MKALVYLGPRRMELQEVAEPVAGPGDVVIDAVVSAVCGSDLHGFREASSRRIPPLVMGHETVGRIGAVGSGVDPERLGQRVVLKPILSCGRCDACRAGDTIHYEGMEATVGALRPNIALLPVNGRHAEREARGIVGNLNEREAAWLAATIGSETLIPMHYDLFTQNLGSAPEVVEAAEEEDRAVTVMIPPRETPFVLVAGRAR